MPDIEPHPEPWERQTGEPNRWFSRFERYRLAGPTRSVVRTWTAEQAEKSREKQTKVPGSWNQAAIRWRWRERAEAWDEHERQKAREAHAQAVEEMNQRHLQEGQAFQSKGIQCLKALESGDVSAADALRFVTEGTKLERIARGEPETIQEKRHAGPGGGKLKITLEDAVAAIKELEEWERANLPVERDGNG